MVRSLAGTDVAVCTHGDVIAEILVTLADEDRVDLGPNPRQAKGSMWVLEGRDGAFSSAKLLPPGGGGASLSGPEYGDPAAGGAGEHLPLWCRRWTGRARVLSFAMPREGNPAERPARELVNAREGDLLAENAIEAASGWYLEVRNTKRPSICTRRLGTAWRSVRSRW